MTIHKVKNPFFCRKDQFAEKGIPGQVLVVGVALAALTGPTHKMMIGSSKDVYEAPVTDIQMMGQQWINPNGKPMLITPVQIFKKTVDGESVKA